MPRVGWTLLAGLVGTLCTIQASAQEHAGWRDPSPHASQFVTVDDNVRLEILDWGGTGRSIVLLTGLGNTAHVYDDFAKRLTPLGHVYAITRRGYGKSSAPSVGYDANRLGDDVLAVLDALKLTTPLLIGHSIAGQELSSVASRHPERIAGVVYLDALFSYAYTTPDELKLQADLKALASDLQAMSSQPLDPLGVPQPADALDRTLRAMSRLQEQLAERRASRPPAPPAASGSAPAPGPPQPTAADLASFAALDAWFARVRGFHLPESELRQGREALPDGRVGRSVTPPTVPAAILAGERVFTDIRAPALALSALQGGELSGIAEAARNQREARWAAFEKNVAGSRVVRVRDANHYVFITNEAEVLREIEQFVKRLK